MTNVAAGPVRGTAELLVDIQASVRDRLELVRQELHHIMTADLPLVREVGAHLLSTRGKLFRPTLALLASAVDDTPQPRAVTVAAVIELMHMATLVHDDSVDHSVVRRGLPSVNSLFSHEISVIMGDFLFSRALVAMVRTRDLDIIESLTNVTNELTIGEMRQLGAVDRLGFSEGEYLQLIQSKTGALISAACGCGALCGAERHRAAMARYGNCLGMAFQVADDILDYTEDEVTTGKPGGNDLQEHKVTLPLILALPRVSAAARQRIDALFASDTPDDTLIREVIGIVTDAGGVDLARQRGAAIADEAVGALKGLPETPARAALQDAIVYVMERRS